MTGGVTGPVAGGETTAARPIRIGITGPIGCGKSTVAGWLGELGAVVIDADRVARRLTPPGSDLLAAVVDTFGRRVLRGDGTLDRAALGRIAFQDPAQLAQLEAIIHPAVRPRIIGLLEAAEAAGPNRESGANSASGTSGTSGTSGASSASGRPSAVVIEAIKLVEGGLAGLCDEVWLVTCDSAVQRKRIAVRDAAAGQSPDPADAEARIAAQSDLVKRLTPSATRILDTSGSIAESRRRVEAAFREAVATQR